jgi:hypothetical protein
MTLRVGDFGPGCRAAFERVREVLMSRAMRMLHDRVVAEDMWKHWPTSNALSVFVVAAGFSRAVRSADDPQ